MWWSSCQLNWPMEIVFFLTQSIWFQSLPFINETIHSNRFRFFFFFSFSPQNQFQSVENIQLFGSINDDGEVFWGCLLCIENDCMSTMCHDTTFYENCQRDFHFGKEFGFASEIDGGGIVLLSIRLTAKIVRSRSFVRSFIQIHFQKMLLSSSSVWSSHGDIS